MQPSKVATPTLDKLGLVQTESQVVGAFIEWLGEQGIVLCSAAKSCDTWLGDKSLAPIGESTDKLLARYFGIDLDAAERERVALLNEARRASATRDVAQPGHESQRSAGGLADSRPDVDTRKLVALMAAPKWLYGTGSRSWHEERVT